jgi:hypothetical protein
MSLYAFLDWDGWPWLEAIFTVVVWCLVIRAMARKVNL